PAAVTRDRFELPWVRPEPGDVLETIRRIVWHHDAPTPIRGRLAQWHVLREAGRHVKVVLDGQGGDELLAGYSRFVVPYALDRLRGDRRSLARELAGLARIETRSRVWFLALAAVRAAPTTSPRRSSPGGGSSASRRPRPNGYGATRPGAQFESSSSTAAHSTAATSTAAASSAACARSRAARRSTWPTASAASGAGSRSSCG